MFENMLDDPQSAATLFEMVEPSLPKPTAVLRELTPVPGMPRWTLRTEAGTYRLKMAGDVGTAAQLARGAAMLDSLPPLLARALTTRGGVPQVPLPRRLELNLNETDLSVAVEERLGSGDARAAWPTLSTAMRCAVAVASARMLLTLHAVPLADVRALRTAGTGWAEFRHASSTASYEYGVPPPGAVPAAAPPPTQPAKPEPAPRAERPPRPWRDVVCGRIERRVAALRGDGVLDAGLLTRVEERLRTAAAALPVDLERRPCHGGFGLESVALSRQKSKVEVIGLQDFELACPGDPWMDVAYWLASSGDPDGRAAHRFFETYRDAVVVPADLPARIDLYAGLTVLRAIAHLTPSFTDEGCSAIADVTESWVSTAPRVWI